MRYFKPSCFALMFLILALLALCFAPGCTFVKPQKTFVLDLAAQASGVLVAEQVPGIAQELLEYSETVLAVPIENFSQQAFDKWSAGVIARLDIHPLLKVNFSEVIKLVKIEVELADNQQEIVKLFYVVIQNFIVGIKAVK